MQHATETIFTSHISSHVSTATLKLKMKTMTKSYKITTCFLSHFKVFIRYLSISWNNNSVLTILLKLQFCESVARNKTYKIL